MTAIERLDPEPGTLTRWAGLIGPASLYAERIANTGFVPVAMRGKPDEITAAIMYGDEIGVGPMQALASINVINGRPSPSAQLLRALILAAGHTLTVHESDETRARMSGLRAGRPESERLTIIWTIEQARAAGLLNNPAWRSYPRQMLVNRASSELGRVLFADVIRGLGYVDDESPTDDVAALLVDGADVAAEQPRKAIGRRTRPKRATPPTPEPDAADPPVAPPLDPRPAEGAHTEKQPEPATEPRDPVSPIAGVEDVPLPGDVPPTSRGLGSPRLINAEQLTALHAAITDVYKQMDRDQGDRDEKLRLLSAIVGRPLTTSKDITRIETVLAFDVLSAILAGQATFWVHPETGDVTVDDLRGSHDIDPVNFDDDPDRWGQP